MKKKPPKVIQRHWDKVGDLPCSVSGYKPATLHHCHGGSMAQFGLHKGMGQKTSDWLVIPLAPKYHALDPWGIDGTIGVEHWEHLFGRQVDHLDEVCRLLSYNVWRRAGIARDVEGVCCF